MTESHNQFGHITSFKADAIGQPGERRFRLLAEAADGRTAVLWLEKEQLFNLAVALKRLMAIAERDVEGLGAETVGMEEMPGPFSLMMREIFLGFMAGWLIGTLRTDSSSMQNRKME